VHGAVRPGHRNLRRSIWPVVDQPADVLRLIRNAGRFGRLVFLSSGAVYDVGRSLDRSRGATRGICAGRRARSVQERDRPVSGPGAFARGSAERGRAPTVGVFGKYEDYAIRFVSNAICKTLLDYTDHAAAESDVQLHVRERSRAHCREIPYRAACGGRVQRGAGLDRTTCTISPNA